jgi:hypothetical protein
MTDQEMEQTILDNSSLDFPDGTHEAVRIQQQSSAPCYRLAVSRCRRPRSACCRSRRSEGMVVAEPSWSSIVDRLVGRLHALK